MKNSVLLSRDIEVLVCSSGGVGTTFLIDAIRKYKRTNHPDNIDGYKHITIPPISTRTNVRAIFVMGDPVLATISLFRRNYHSQQSIHLNRFRFAKKLIPNTKNINDYAADGVQGFAFDFQLNNWMSLPIGYKTLFIKYDSIHDHLDIIKEFLGLPESFVLAFPEKKVRSSSLDDLDTETKTNLIGINQEISEVITLFDEYFVLPERSNTIGWISFLFKYGPAFLMDYMGHFVKTILKRISPSIYKTLKQGFRSLFKTK